MDFVFTTFSALFLLLAAASCAPAGLQHACSDVRSSSLELNHIAKIVARNGSKDVINFTTSLVWMEAKDMCDPETLKHKSETCIGKIFDALTSYISAVKTLAGFQSCSESVSKVNATLHKLHTDMSRCVKLREETDHQKESLISKDKPLEPFEKDLLCHYTMDRLFSFSILTARVFAVGDPAHHTEASSQKCM